MAAYTPQDYVIYFVILLGLLWFFTNVVFKRIEFDDRFLLIVVPFFVFGLALRMLADVGVVERSKLWNITPGVHVVTLLLGALAIGIGLLLKKRYDIDYWKFPVAAGTLLALVTGYNLAIHINHPVRILYPFVLAGAITGVIYLASGLSRHTEIFKMPGNVAIIFAHMLDGSATFIGIDYYHFVEEHILPEFFILLADSAIVMIPLKILVVLPILYLVERWYKEEGEIKESEYMILKLVLFMLGFGPGFRDAILPGTLV
jgi:uncharacterized membrane protein